MQPKRAAANLGLRGTAAAVNICGRYVNGSGSPLSQPMPIQIEPSLAVQITPGAEGAPYVVTQFERPAVPLELSEVSSYTPTGGFIWVERGGMDFEERLLIAIKQCLMGRFGSAHTI